MILLVIGKAIVLKNSQRIIIWVDTELQRKKIFQKKIPEQKKKECFQGERKEAVGGVLQVQKKEQGGDLHEERRPNTV